MADLWARLMESSNDPASVPFSGFNTTAPGGYKYAVQSGRAGLTNASIWDGIDNLFTGNLDYQRTLETLANEQSYNAQEAAKERDWSKMMSDTSHQREAEDLIAAGFNPALSLSSGGANAYTAAAASSPAARDFNSGKGFGLLLNLISGLVSLGVNNARKVDAMNNLVDMNNSKLNVLQDHFINQDSTAALKAAALSKHWNNQDVVFANQGLNITNHYQNKDRLDYAKFKYNQWKGYRG